MNARRIWPELVFAAIIVVLGGFFLLRPPSLPCLFHALTTYPCLACRGTRALTALVSGDLAGALAMNPLVVLGAFGAGAFVVYTLVLLLARKPPLRPDFRRGLPLAILRYGTISAIAANWIYLIATEKLVK